jgi:CRP-like cAMP-binding protein
MYNHIMPINKSISERLTNLFSASHVITFTKHETIIKADDDPQGVYYLEKGFVKMNSILADGREITLNIFKPGSYFPMMWAISNLPNTYYFQTMTPVVVRRISQNVFFEFVTKNPDVLLDITNRILVGVNGLLFNINHILSGDSRHRIMAALLMFAKRFGEASPSGKITITLPLTHQDIADVAAITRETASIHIKQLENQGLISQKSHLLTILNMQKLEAELDSEQEELSPEPSL